MLAGHVEARLRHREAHKHDGRGHGEGPDKLEQHAHQARCSDQDFQDGGHHDGSCDLWVCNGTVCKIGNLDGSSDMW